MPPRANKPLEPTKFSQLIRARRDARGLSRRDVYKRIGLSEATLDSYETQGRMPRMDVGVQLMHLLRITPEEYCEALGAPSVPNARAATPGQMLVVYRERLRWSIEEMAQEIGITSTELESYEDNRAEPPASVMARMMAVLDRFRDDNE